MNKDLQNSYDQVAGAYAEQFRNELDHKPFDRKMLDWLAEKVGDVGPISDMGCGPGHIARYLHDRGANVCGIDLSAEMVKQAALLHPDIKFTQGDMLRLDAVADDSFFFETEEIKNYLVRAGFTLEEVVERDPYPEVEYQSRRAYIFARNPGA